MSEFTDSLITQHLDQAPDLRHAYHHDAPTYHNINLLRRLLETTEKAMEDEGVPVATRARVLRAVVYGDADNPTPRLTRQEELRLLLADMTEFEPMNSVFGSVQLADEFVDDVTPERMAAWLKKEAARLREATGYDLRTEAEKRRDEEQTDA